MYRIVLWHQLADNRVTGFVIGGVGFFFVRHDHGAALGAHHNFVTGLLKFFHAHHTAITASGKQRRFIDQVGQIGTGEARRATSDDTQLYAVINRYFARVNFKNLFATANIRQADIDLAIKSAWTQ